MKKKATSRIFVGLFLILLGAVLVICSKPYFSYTIEKLEQIQRSETIMNYSFEIHQSQDKMVQVQMVIGQTLDISASGNKNFTFLIANYTNPENDTALDKPDVTYYVLNSTLSVNTTWSPQTRTAEPGNYCLTFLARDFPAESPVHVYADITKKWTDMNTKTVVAPDLKALIDPNYEFVGLGVFILGGIVLVHTFYQRHRPRSQRGKMSAKHVT
jgi:hypothetical protein